MSTGFSMVRRGLLATVGSAGLCGLARAAHEFRPWPAGKAAPAWSATDLDGRVWQPGSPAGEVLVLNFWATWCEPCRAEMPSLERLQQRHAAEGLRVVALNFKEGALAVERFLAASPLALPVALDPAGTAAAAFGVRVLPSTVLIDRLGRPRGTVLGELDWNGEAAAALVGPLLVAGRRS